MRDIFLKHIYNSINLLSSFIISFSILALLFEDYHRKACPQGVPIYSPSYYAIKACSQANIYYLLASLVTGIAILFVLYLLKRQRPQDAKRITLSALFLAAIILLISTFIQYQHTAIYRKPAKTAFMPSLTPYPSPTPKVATSTYKKDWRIYKGSTYSISFPSDWELSGPITMNMNFPEVITLLSPSKSTALSIGLEGDIRGGWEPWGEQDPRTFTETERTIEVAGKTLKGRQRTILNPPNSAVSESYSETLVSVTADSYQYLATDIIRGTGPKLYPIVFIYGNIFPVLKRTNDPFQAQEDFKKDEIVINEILQTFEFHPIKNIKANGTNYTYFGEIIDPKLVTVLDITRNNLHILPYELIHFTNLQILYLNNNNIEVLPNTLASLSKLRSLDLTGNPISTQELQRIKKLLPRTNILHIQPMNLPK